MFKERIFSNMLIICLSLSCFFLVYQQALSGEVGVAQVTDDGIPILRDSWPEFQELPATAENWQKLKVFLCEQVMKLDDEGCERMYGLHPTAVVSHFPPHAHAVVERFFAEHVVGKTNINTTELIKDLYETLPDDGMYSDADYLHSMNFGGTFAAFRMQASPLSDMRDEGVVAEYLFIATW